MSKNSSTSNAWQGDLLVLLLLASARLIFHLLTNHEYGFHRDELGTLEEARFLAWGYVAYPPVTPLLVRTAWEWFGPSPTGVRVFSALAQSAVMVLTGLMARDLGGSRWAQVVAALAVAAAPLSMLMGAMTQYVSFDYLWWVLAAFFLIRLLKSDNPRWWLAVGATLGIGMMTKYTMGFLVVAIVAGVLLTPTRRYLRSPWLWGGTTLSLLIFLPNLIWQVQHGFISLDFLSSIHARDVQWGRTSGYLPEQLYVNASPLTIPLWLGGLLFYFRLPAGRRYRLIGWLYVIPFVLFLVAQGRSYYLGAAYPMLLAAGAVAWESWLATRLQAQSWRRLTWVGLALSLVISVVLMTPIAPVNSPLWAVSNATHDNFREQVGWPDLVDIVAEIYHSLPPEEQAQTAILAGNIGVAGALNFYGPTRDLPRAISPVNTMWLRGYGDVAPAQVLALGFDRTRIATFFVACEQVGAVANRFGVENEESERPEIWLCREPRQPWDELWQQMQAFN